MRIGKAKARFRDRTRSVRHHLFEIAQQSRRVGKQLPAKMQAAYGRLIGTTRAVMRETQWAVEGVRRKARRLALEVPQEVKGLRQEVADMSELTRRVVAQAKARVLKRDTHYPHKIFSVFETPTAAVRTGRAKIRLAQVEADLGEAKTEHEDYNYIAKVFGPDEVQLCEIQAAGPQVSSLVSALLEGCFDNKFEIRFRTQRPRADGRGMADDFDVEIRNKNLDRTCLVDELSGGQFVLVNEAANLGIAFTTCGRVKAFATRLSSGTKLWELWILQTPRSMCACCAGPWTWAASTK